MNKILHISKYYPPFQGGIEESCQLIVNNIRGFEHRVICFNDNTHTVNETVNNANILRVGTSLVIASQPIALSYFYHLNRTIKTFRPDIIHFHAPNPLISLFLLMLIPKKAKLVVHWHSDIIEQKDTIYKPYKPFEKNLLKRADRIIITSPNYLEKSEPLESFKEKIHVIPNLVDEHKLNFSVDDKQLIKLINEKYQNKKIVFFIGRHVPYKGIQNLLDAEPYINSECELVIAGTGPLTEDIRTRIKSNKRIHLLGKITDKELKLYYYASTVFAFPSITKNEAFGVALAEAMYCGLTPVTFRISGSGVNWVSLKNITGLEVENCNSKAYAEAINKLLEDDKLRNELSENAVKRVKENFVLSVVERKITDLYSQIIINK